jgi:hypothetical protein
LKSLLLLNFLLTLAPGVLAATNSLSPFSGTNNMIILSTNGMVAGASMVVFRGDVHVFDPRMYLECDLLTVLLQTNKTGQADKAGTTNTSVDTIIAETNVLMMARGTTIIGDRAVYTESNEVAVVTGDLVVIVTDKSYTYGTNFVFNRRSNDGYAVGWTVVEIKLDASVAGTNAPRPSPGIDRKRIDSPRPRPKEPRNQ